MRSHAGPTRTVIVISLLSLTVPAFAGVKEGVEKWQAGDHKAAVIEWLPFAAKGDPDALFNLGQAYKLGRGVPLDKTKAEDFYRRAADKGHAPAQSNLGILLAQRGDKAAAAALWQKAAEKKESRAQYMLGVLHFNGDTLEKNWPLAYAYMLQANDAGLPQAERALATMNANIPQADRDRGTTLAGTMAGDRLANSGKALSPPRKTGTATPVSIDAAPVAAALTMPEAKQVNVPAAVAGAALPAAASFPVAAQPRPVVAKAAVPTPAVLPAAVPTPAVLPAAAAAATPPPTTATNGWRVQLGAFSQEARARETWTTLVRDQQALVAAQSPHYVAGDNVVRLQIGSFHTKAAAAALCERLKTAGRACFVVEAN